MLTKLVELLRERRPALMVIDSFKALRAYAPDDGTFRRFLHDLAGHLSASQTTSFWVGEYDSAEATEAPEFAVADAIVSLGIEHSTDRESRVFQVLKLRGSGFVSGKHAYRVSSDGIDIFPRLADHEDGETYDFALERISSGVSILDEMLADGYWRGASTLVAGPSGAGKTLVALHFVFCGAELGEQGIFATFQENPVQLERIVQGFSWSFKEPKVELMFRPPVDLYLDEWVYDLLGSDRAHRGKTSGHRQSRRPPSGVWRRDPIPRVHVLAPATLRPTQRQRDHDPGSSGAVRNHSPVRVRDLPRL